MSEKPDFDQDELSLLDIYTFFKDGWKMLSGFAALGLSVGLITAFVLPEKFLASAQIEPARVAEKNAELVISKSVEPVAVLAEKMRSPTYYSDATIEVCDLSQKANPLKNLVDKLKPSVARNSQYVSVSYLANSPTEAVTCLGAVLKDVINNQAEIAKPLINNMEVILGNAELELNASISEQEQQRVKNREKLNISKLKLTAAKAFVEQFSKDSLHFKFGDPQFSASVLLLSTLVEKQREIKDLEIQISALELEIAANQTDKDQRVRSLTNRLAEMKNAISAPMTKDASFATPIYAPQTKAEPRRSLIVVVSLAGGIFLGLLILIAVRLRNNLRRQLPN